MTMSFTDAALKQMTGLDNAVQRCDETLQMKSVYKTSSVQKHSENIREIVKRSKERARSEIYF